MSGRSLLPPNAGRGPFMPGLHHPTGRPLDVPPLNRMVYEEKMAVQHEEMKRIMTENQRLAVTHVALREELAAAQSELERMHQVLAGIRGEKDEHVKGLAEKLAKTEAEFRGIEPLKAEIQRAQTEAQKLLAHRDELGTRIQQLSQELNLARMEAQQTSMMRSEIEGLRQEIAWARGAFEFEKKANSELVEQKQVMEKNLISMAREVEKIRAELTNAEKRSLGGGYGGEFGHESGYPANPYSEKYGITQMLGPVEKGASFGSQSGPAWGPYDLKRGGPPTKK